MSLPVEPTAAGDALLDPPPITPSRLHALEGAVAGLFETRLDIVLPQGEAVLPLEAAARGLGRPGVRALNLDTRPYGAAFGRWLRQAGATVVGIAPEFRQPVRPEAVERALQNDPDISIVSLVHVEAASCIRNDAEAITSLVREHGALLVIDVVASIGAHEVLLDGWGADIAVIGPQKALAGPAGISIAAVSRRGWQAVSANPEAPRLSLLSLLDWKERWLDSDRSAIPGTPAPLEVIALEAAVARVLARGPEKRAASPPRSCGREPGGRPGTRDHALCGRRRRGGGRDHTRGTDWLRRPGTGRTGAIDTRRRDLARLRRARRERHSDRPHGPARQARRRARSACRTWVRPQSVVSSRRVDPRSTHRC